MEPARYLPYAAYMLALFIFLIPIFATPIFIAPNDENTATTVYTIYALTCHQLTSRSFCYFPTKVSIEDCFSSSTLQLTRANTVVKDGAVGYKFPVCARDVGFYSAAFLGGILFAIVRRLDDDAVPRLRYFIIALIPIGIDGITQLFGWRESTNLLRFLTGALAGIVVPFYLFPIINKIIFSRQVKTMEKKAEKKI